MSQEENLSSMADADPDTSKEVERCGRAKPFLYSELVDMVRYLERRRYGDPDAAPTYRRKQVILQKLSKKLFRKYGTMRDPRQIQKRFSDLKVRQATLLGKIHDEILQGEGPSTLRTPLMSPNNCDGNHQTITFQEQNTRDQTASDLEEMVTLDLHPITLEESLQIPPPPKAHSTSERPIIPNLLLELQNTKQLIQEISGKVDVMLQVVENLIFE